MAKRLWTVTAIMGVATIAVGLASAQEMAALIINVKTGDEPANASIRVLTKTGDVVGRGRSGDTIAVPPGCYLITVQNLDLLDKPMRRRADVWLKAGTPTRHTSEWPVSKAKVVTRVGKRPIQSKVVLFLGGGGEPLCEFRSGEFIRISPGHYDAKIYRGSTYTSVSGLHFRSGGDQIVPVDIR